MKLMAIFFQYLYKFFKGLFALIVFELVEKLLTIASIPLYCFSFKYRQKALIRSSRVLTESEMPILRPIPVPSVQQPTFYDQLLVYIFVPREWRLLQNWSVDYIEKNGSQVRLVVPKGARCDAASIPRPFRSLFNPTGLLLLPALLHDYAYKYNQLWQVDAAGNFSPYRYLDGSSDEEQRQFWDDLLYQAGMQLNGFAPINKAIRWLGKFGLTKKTWDNYRQENKKPGRPSDAGDCLCQQEN